MKSNKEALQIVRGMEALRSVTVPTETVSIPAGAAGTLKNFQLLYRPILDATGGSFGGDGDTSLALTSTAFDNEVPYGTDDADLANGDYYVNYVTGQGRGRKKDTSTSATATYKVMASTGGGAGGGSAASIPPTTAKTNGLATFLRVSGRCEVSDIRAYNSAGGSNYLHIFDSNSNPPANSSVPDMVIYPGDKENSFYTPPGKKVFSNGCVAVWSSTEDTLTIVASAALGGFIEIDYYV